jgi:hypothetical protein
MKRKKKRKLNDYEEGWSVKTPSKQLDSSFSKFEEDFQYFYDYLIGKAKALKYINLQIKSVELIDKFDADDIEDIYGRTEDSDELFVRFTYDREE